MRLQGKTTYTLQGSSRWNVLSMGARTEMPVLMKYDVLPQEKSPAREQRRAKKALLPKQNATAMQNNFSSMCALVQKTLPNLLACQKNPTPIRAKLTELAEMHRDGLINDEELARARASALGGAA
jgi:hypothetical protein